MMKRIIWSLRMMTLLRVMMRVVIQSVLMLIWIWRVLHFMVMIIIV